MFGLSLGHIIILVVILLLFGSKRIPGVAGALGRGIRQFKKGLSGVEDLNETNFKKMNEGTRNPDEIIDKDGKNIKS